MRRIRNINTVKDPSGRVVEVQTEQLADDHDGMIVVRNDQVYKKCSGCYRPTPVAELRGQCDHCRSRTVCRYCIAGCQACGRTVCGKCRRTFVGSRASLVCPSCLPRLQQYQRIAIRDRAAQARFQRQLILRRDAERRAALRAKSQQDRAKLRLANTREQNRVRMALARLKASVIRSIR